MNDQTPSRRLTAADFDQELLDLYDYYAHGRFLSVSSWNVLANGR
ncbi:hypothetical protein [Ruegeria profundi]|nr:hypothetical protein [Ruegeria profundi]